MENRRPGALDASRRRVLTPGEPGSFQKIGKYRKLLHLSLIPKKHVTVFMVSTSHQLKVLRDHAAMCKIAVVAGGRALGLGALGVRVFGARVLGLRLGAFLLPGGGANANGAGRAGGPPGDCFPAARSAQERPHFRRDSQLQDGGR